MRGGGNDDDDEVLNKCIMDMYVLYVDGREVQRERRERQMQRRDRTYASLAAYIHSSPLFRPLYRR